MMFLLQLVMCLSFVNICSGMDKENHWKIENISRAYSNPYHNNYSDHNVIQGHLEIYELKEKDKIKHYVCFKIGQSFFLSLPHFNNKKYEEIRKLIPLDTSGETALDIPLYIKISRRYEEKPAKIVKILEVKAIKIEFEYESTKLLNIYGLDSRTY